MKKFLQKILKRLLLILGLISVLALLIKVTSKKADNTFLISDPSECSCEEGCDKCVFYK